MRKGGTAEEQDRPQEVLKEWLDELFLGEPQTQTIAAVCVFTMRANGMTKRVVEFSYAFEFEHVLFVLVQISMTDGCLFVLGKSLNQCQYLVYVH